MADRDITPQGSSPRGPSSLMEAAPPVRSISYRSGWELSQALRGAAEAIGGPSLDHHLPADVRDFLYRLELLLAYASGWIGALAGAEHGHPLA